MARDDASRADRASDARLTEMLEHDVRQVLRTLQGSSLEEVRLEYGGLTVRVRREWDSPLPPAEALDRPIAEHAATGAALNRLAVPGRTEVRARVVGVFHRARDVDGPPLADEGMLVESGKPLGVVETLGIPNDVLAPARGRLVEIVVQDGQTVEYGELIAVIVAE